jgi:hypothetical protein
LGRAERSSPLSLCSSLEENVPKDSSFHHHEELSMQEIYDKHLTEREVSVLFAICGAEFITSDRASIGTIHHFMSPKKDVLIYLHDCFTKGYDTVRVQARKNSPHSAATKEEKIDSLRREYSLLVDNHAAQQKAKKEAGYAGTSDHRDIMVAIREVEAELSELGVYL